MIGAEVREFVLCPIGRKTKSQRLCCNLLVEINVHPMPIAITSGLPRKAEEPPRCPNPVTQIFLMFKCV